MNQSPSHHTATRCVIEVGWVPATFTSHLEATGIAAMCAQTVDGVYLECRAPLATVLDAFSCAGLKVRAVRPAGMPPSWRDGVRSAAQAQERLRNIRAATWLPTLPAA